MIAARVVFLVVMWGSSIASAAQVEPMTVGAVVSSQLIGLGIALPFRASKAITGLPQSVAVQRYRFVVSRSRRRLAHHPTVRVHVGTYSQASGHPIGRWDHTRSDETKCIASIADSQ